MLWWSVLRDCDIVDADTVHPCQWGGCEAADWAQPAQLSLQLHITYPPLPPPTLHQLHHTPPHHPGHPPPSQYRYTALQQGQALGEQRVFPDLAAQVLRFSIFKEL